MKTYIKIVAVDDTPEGRGLLFDGLTEGYIYEVSYDDNDNIYLTSLNGKWNKLWTREYFDSAVEFHDVEAPKPARLSGDVRLQFWKQAALVYAGDDTLSPSAAASAADDLLEELEDRQEDGLFQ